MHLLLHALLLIHPVEERRIILSTHNALPSGGHATVGVAHFPARRHRQQLLVVTGGQVAGCKEALTGDACGLFSNLASLENISRSID